MYLLGLPGAADEITFARRNLSVTSLKCTTLWSPQNSSPCAKCLCTSQQLAQAGEMNASQTLISLERKNHPSLHDAVLGSYGAAD